MTTQNYWERKPKPVIVQRELIVKIKTASELRVLFILLFVITGILGGGFTFFYTFFAMSGRLNAFEIGRTITIACATITGLIFWGGLVLFCSSREGTIVIPKRQDRENAA